MRDIQMVLERWGQWAQDNSGVDYSPIAAGFKGLLPDSRKSKPSCCDNDGLIIDGAVGRLKKVRDERAWRHHAALSLWGVKVGYSTPLEDF
ncbi:hypothetical protein SME46J_12810 [Serratia marcescens]|nr:hypothetical protein SME46J_12810 [Serratia marcescens]